NAITPCVHTEFNVQDQPQNSKCLDGWRFIPIELIDLPGLIKDAWAGKGLGNQFLSVATQSDALLHVIDVSGSVDASGKITEVENKDFNNFDMDDSKKFAACLRHVSKPTLIVANKIDLPGADKNFDRLREKYVNTIIIPASADSELSLRRAEQKGLIKYVPG